MIGYRTVLVKRLMSGLRESRSEDTYILHFFYGSYKSFLFTGHDNSIERQHLCKMIAHIHKRMRSDMTFLHLQNNGYHQFKYLLSKFRSLK